MRATGMNTTAGDPAGCRNARVTVSLWEYKFSRQESVSVPVCGFLFGTSIVLPGQVVEKLSGWVFSCSAVPQWEVVQSEHILLIDGGQERPGER